MASHRAEVGDVYLLRVGSGGQEFHTGRAEARGLRQAVGVLKVTAEAIEAGGTAVETTWTRDRCLHFVSWDGSGWSPVQPRGQGWFEDHRSKGHGSTADSARAALCGVARGRGARLARRADRQARRAKGGVTRSS